MEVHIIKNLSNEYEIVGKGHCRNNQDALYTIKNSLEESIQWCNDNGFNWKYKNETT